MGQYAYSEELMRQYQSETEGKFQGQIAALNAQKAALQAQIASLQAQIASILASASEDDPYPDVSGLEAAIAQCEMQIAAIDACVSSLYDAISETSRFINELISKTQHLDLTSEKALEMAKQAVEKYTNNMNRIMESFEDSVSLMTGDLAKIVETFETPEMLALNTLMAATLCYPTLAEAFCGDPVDLLTGAFLWQYRDLSLEGAKPLQFERYYASNMVKRDVGLGRGWSHSFAYKLEIEKNMARLFLPQGKLVFFEKTKKGEYRLKPEGAYALEEKDGGFLLRHAVDGTTVHFNEKGDPKRIEQRNGDAVITEYEDGKIVRAHNPSGSIAFTYTGSRLTSVSDHAGREIKFTFNERGNLTGAANPDGDLLEYAYDKKNLLISIRDFNGTLYLENTYGEDGRIATQYVAGQGTSKFEYDTTARKHRFTRNDGFFTEIEYDENSRILSSADNDGVHYYTYDNLNRRTSDTDKLGRVTRYRYAKNSSNVVEVTHPDGTQTQFTYDALNRMTTRKDANSGPTGGGLTSYEYDGRGNLSRVTDPLGGMRTLRYDENNFLQSSTDALGNETKLTCDEKGNVVALTDPLGNTTRFQYDKIGRLTSRTGPLGYMTTYKYSVAGKLISETDALGQTREYTYTPNGYRASESDWNGNITAYTYNEVNKPLSVTDAMGGIATRAYDEAGNVIREISPEGRKISYTYDTAGRPICMTDAMGNTYTYEYDAMGKLTVAADPMGGKETFVYTNRDKLAEAADKLGGVTKYETDAMGRVIKMTDPMGGETTYEYDANGNRTSVTDPNGNSTLLVYDAENRPVKMIDALGNETIFAYNAAGQLTSVQTAGGESAKADYDANGNIASATDLTGSVTKFAYDALGRLMRKTDGLLGETAYEYDNNGNKVKETDANGNASCFEYDKNNRLIKKTDPLGVEETYTYTPDGLLAGEVNGLGGVTAYEYDANRNLIKVTDPVGSVFTFAYDALNRMVSAQDPNGNTREHSYDANGNRTETRNADGGILRFEHDLNGRIVKAADAEGYVSAYAYDAKGNLNCVTDPLGNTRRAEYDALNHIVKVTDALGNETSFQYDAMGRTTRAVNADGAITLYTYDANSKLTSVTDAMGHMSTFAYDALGRLLERTDENGVCRRYAYDANGNVVLFTDGLGNSESYEYDALNRLTRYADRRGGAWAYEYNALGRVTSETDALGNSQHFEYDKNGRITAVTDRNGNKTRYVLDGMGNVVEQIDAKGHSTKLEYDSMGRVTALKQHRIDGQTEEHSVTLYTYDKRGLVKTEVNANGDGRVFVYDGGGRLIQVTDEDGNTTEYGYDARGLANEVRFADGRSALYIYNGAGKLTFLKDWTGETRIERDALDRVLAVTDGGCNTTRYSYDPVGNLNELLYPDGRAARYTYDAENNNTGLTDPDGNILTFNFDPNGNLAKKVYPNGEMAAYAYDPNNRVTELLEYAKEGSLSLNTGYTWDAQGNRTGETRKKAAEIETRSFTYDTLNRMVESVEPHAGKTSYVYDTLGNLVQEANGSKSIQRTYNALNQLLQCTDAQGQTSFAYDKRGNRIRENTPFGTKTYTYDAMGMLAHGANEKNEQSSYTYNSLGFRVQRSQTLADGNNENRSYVVDFTSPIRRDLMVNVENEFTQSLIYANGQLIEEVTQNRTPEGGLPRLLAVHEDIMGSIRSLTTEHGDVFAQIEYDVWGKPIHNGEHDMNAALLDRYTNHTYDAVLDAYHAQYRFYDVANKAFTSKDPVKDGLNWYGYVEGNPATFTDPLGLDGPIGPILPQIRDIGATSKIEPIDVDNKVQPYFPNFSCGVSPGTVLSQYAIGLADSIVSNFLKGIGAILNLYDREYAELVQRTFDSVFDILSSAYGIIDISYAKDVRSSENYYRGRIAGDIIMQAFGAYKTVLGFTKLVSAFGGTIGINNIFGGIGTLSLVIDGVLIATAVVDLAEGVGISTAAKTSFDNDLMAFTKITNSSGGNIQRPTVNYNGNDVPVYRGGKDFTVKPNEIRIKNGMVQTGHGVSLNVNPNQVPGTANRIEYLPSGLSIIQRGSNPGHYEIVPTRPMSLDNFQILLNQIRTVSD